MAPRQELPRKTLEGLGPQLRCGLEQFPSVSPEVSRTRVRVAGSRSGSKACAQRGVRLRVNNRGRAPGESLVAFPVRQSWPSTSPSCHQRSFGGLGVRGVRGPGHPCGLAECRPPRAGAARASSESGGGARRAATSSRSARAEPSKSSGDTAQDDSTPLGERKSGVRVVLVCRWRRRVDNRP